MGEDKTKNDGDKLNAIANLVSAGGGAIGTIGGLFGKGPQQPTYGSNPTDAPKSDENKKKQKQLLIYGGAAVLLIVILLMFKKK